MMRFCAIALPKTAMCESGTASSIMKLPVSIKRGTLRPPPPMPDAPASTPHTKSAAPVT